MSKRTHTGDRYPNFYARITRGEGARTVLSLESSHQGVFPERAGPESGMLGRITECQGLPTSRLGSAQQREPLAVEVEVAGLGEAAGIPTRLLKSPHQTFLLEANRPLSPPQGGGGQRRMEDGDAAGCMLPGDSRPPPPPPPPSTQLPPSSSRGEQPHPAPPRPTHPAPRPPILEATSQLPRADSQGAAGKRDEPARVPTFRLRPGRRGFRKRATWSGRLSDAASVSGGCAAALGAGAGAGESRRRRRHFTRRSRSELCAIAGSRLPAPGLSRPETATVKRSPAPVRPARRRPQPRRPHWLRSHWLRPHPSDHTPLAPRRPPRRARSGARWEGGVPAWAKLPVGCVSQLPAPGLCSFSSKGDQKKKKKKNPLLWGFELAWQHLVAVLGGKS